MLGREIYKKTTAKITFGKNKTNERMKDKDTKIPQPYNVFLKKRFFTTSRQKFLSFSKTKIKCMKLNQDLAMITF